MEKVKVEVDITRKMIYEFTVETVLDQYGKPDEEATKIAAAEAYERAVEDGSIGEYFYDDDFEYEIGDIVVDDEDEAEPIRINLNSPNGNVFQLAAKIIELMNQAGFDTTEFNQSVFKYRDYNSFVEACKQQCKEISKVLGREIQIYSSENYEMDK